MSNLETQTKPDGGASVSTAGLGRGGAWWGPQGVKADDEQLIEAAESLHRAHQAILDETQALKKRQEGEQLALQNEHNAKVENIKRNALAAVGLDDTFKNRQDLGRFSMLVGATSNNLIESVIGSRILAGRMLSHVKADWWLPEICKMRDANFPKLPDEKKAEMINDAREWVMAILAAARVEVRPNV